MPIKFERMPDGHLARINDSKHCIVINNDVIRPSNSALYATGSTEKKFYAAEINQMLAGKVIEPMNTEWEAVIVVSFTEDELLCYAMITGS